MARVQIAMIYDRFGHYTQYCPCFTSVTPYGVIPGGIITLGVAKGCEAVTSMNSDLIKLGMLNGDHRPPSFMVSPTIVDTDGATYIKLLMPPGIPCGEFYVDGYRTFKFFVAEPPEITSVSRSVLNAGSTFTVTGKNFNEYQYDGRVQIGEQDLEVVNWDMTEITLKVPYHVVSGDLRITTTIGISNPKEMTILNSGNFTCSITDVTPSPMPRGGLAVITGNGFGEYVNKTTTTLFRNGLGMSTLYKGSGAFPDAVNIVKWTDTSIEAYFGINMHLGTFDLSVKNASGVSNEFRITYNGPTDLALTPVTASPKELVTITGKNISYGTINLPNWDIYVGSTMIKPTSQKPLTFAAPNMPGFNKVEIGIGDVKYLVGTLEVKSVPKAEITGYGDSIYPGGTFTVNGQNLLNVLSVKLGDITCTQVSGIGSGSTGTSFDVKVPYTVKTGVVTVVTRDFGTATGPVFTIKEPKITSIVANVISSDIDNTITIKGENLKNPFASAASVHPAKWTTITIGTTVFDSDPANTSEVEVKLFLAANSVKLSNYVSIKTGALTSNKMLLTIDNTAPPEEDTKPVIDTVGLSSNTVAVISGTNFGPSGKLYFKESETEVISWSDGLIKFNVPADLADGSHGVQVENDLGLLSNVKFIVKGGVGSGNGGTGNVTVNCNHPVATTTKPKFTFVPASGYPGTIITISGTGFGTDTGNVQINGQDAGVLTWSDKEITAKVSSNNITGNLSITNGSWVSYGGMFEVKELPAGMTEADAANADNVTSKNPYIFSSDKNVVSFLSPLTINGINFQEIGTLYVNGEMLSDEYINTWEDSCIRITVPDSITKKVMAVKVATDYGESNTLNIKVSNMIPVISKFYPTKPRINSDIEITGINFGSGKGKVFFGIGKYAQLPESFIKSWSDAAITVTLSDEVDYKEGQVWIVNADEFTSNKLDIVVLGQSKAPSSTISYTEIRNVQGQLVAEVSEIAEAITNIPFNAQIVDNLNVGLVGSHDINDLQKVLQEVVVSSLRPYTLAKVKPDVIGNIAFKVSNNLYINKDKATNTIFIGAVGYTGTDNNVVKDGFCDLNGICRYASEPVVNSTELLDLVLAGPQLNSNLGWKEILQSDTIKVMMYRNEKGIKVVLQLNEKTVSMRGHSHELTADDGWGTGQFYVV